MKSHDTTNRFMASRIAMPVTFAALAAFAIVPTTGFSESKSQTPVTSTVAALHEARECHTCHHASEFYLGPAYDVIRARYANPSDETIEYLATKIIHGGGGNWGIVPMVANPDVSPEEAVALARWILSNDR